MNAVATLPEVITFIVPAIPIGQPRPKARAFNGHAQVYDPKTHPVHEFKATVRKMAREAYSGPPLQGPLQVHCEFVFPRPRAMLWKKRPMPRVPHTQRPDGDNAAKAVFDSLNQLLYVDDSQIFHATFVKWIAAGDEAPHAVITITPINTPSKEL